MFFWFPSALPAQFASSGIVWAEWRVFLGILGLTVLSQTGHFWLRRPVRWPQLALVVGYLLSILLLIRWMLPENGNPLPVDRADWFWLLALLIPTAALRWWLTHRLWLRSWLDLWFAAFILLVLISTKFAPFDSRGLGMVGRPLLGFVIAIHLMTVSRETNSTGYLRRVSVGLCLLIGIMGLTMTQWNEKSDAFQVVINLLPKLNRIVISNSINPNEIGGVLAWVVPLAAGLTLYPWGKSERHWRWLSGIGFIFSFSALFLGQSRFAIAGVLLGLAALSVALISPPWRKWAVAGVMIVLLVEAAVVLNVIGQQSEAETVQSTTAGLSERDSNTSQQRLKIWNTAIHIIRTYPLTGVGMDRFRYNEVKFAFPVVGFDTPDPDNPNQPLRPRPPHAHNEVLQLGTDFGVPGLILAVGIYIIAGQMAYTVWRVGSRDLQIIMIAAACGLLAHTIYGLGDAIPVWDRFAFVFWILVGIIAASYVNSHITCSS